MKLVKARSVSSDQAPPVNQFSATGTRGPSPHTLVLEERGLGPRNEKVLTGIELGRRPLGTEIAHLTARERFKREYFPHHSLAFQQGAGMDGLGAVACAAVGACRLS
jgi:hypothetical protein